MIARTWQGIVPESKSDQYFEYIKNTGVHDIQKTEGNQGVFVFRRSEHGKSYFFMISLWDSFESIQKFAGDDIRKAYYYPEDKDYLIYLEPFVHHFEVLTVTLNSDIY
jgi:heme-degrading monooxygenase HmoA